MNMKNLKIVQNCPKIATLNSYIGPGQCRGQLVMVMVMVTQHLREKITMINYDDSESNDDNDDGHDGDGDCNRDAGGDDADNGDDVVSFQATVYD